MPVEHWSFGGRLISYLLINDDRCSRVLKITIVRRWEIVSKPSIHYVKLTTWRASYAFGCSYDGTLSLVAWKNIDKYWLTRSQIDLFYIRQVIYLDACNDRTWSEVWEQWASARTCILWQQQSRGRACAFARFTTSQLNFTVRLLETQRYCEKQIWLWHLIIDIIITFIIQWYLFTINQLDKSNWLRLVWRI